MFASKTIYSNYVRVNAYKILRIVAKGNYDDRLIDHAGFRYDKYMFSPERPKSQDDLHL